MRVDFKIISYHRLSPEQVSEFSVDQNATFGRSLSNDWHLPDPEKVISGKHLKIFKEADNFYLYDTSTNGVFVNRSVEALGDKKHKLCTNDLLSIGDYEIQVEVIGEQLSSTNGNDVETSVTSDYSQSHCEPVGFFAQDLNTQTPPVINNDLNDAYTPPILIPEEWDYSLKSEDASVDFEKEPKTPSGIKPVIQVKDETVVKSNSEKIESSTTITEKSQTFQVPHSIPTIKPSFELQASHAQNEMDFFLKGLGLSSNLNVETLSKELCFELGQSMNLMFMGLIKLLRNRSSFKTEFKINQTTFQQQENNPLKFSATIDDVFQNLYLNGRTSFLSSDRAIKEIFNDVEKHDKAFSAGTYGALQGILSQLDPVRIKENDYQSHYLDKFLPQNKNARSWGMFTQLHDDLKSEISAQGSSALTDDFVKAYDQTIKSL